MNSPYDLSTKAPNVEDPEHWFACCYIDDTDYFEWSELVEKELESLGIAWCRNG